MAWKKWRDKTPAEKRQHLDWQKGHRLKNNANNRRVCKDYRDKLRRETITAYGSLCECCGESDPRFLTMDHTKGDGAAHRKTLTRHRGGGGHMLFAWLKKRGYPRDGFRLLCWNCNCARHIYGECPHKLPSASSIANRSELTAPAKSPASQFAKTSLAASIIG